MRQSPDTQKPTPSPWKVKDIYQDNGPNIVGIFGPRSATSGFGGYCVAHVAHPRDAALIAAAPSLLEALKSALPYLDDASSSVLRRVHDAIRQAEDRHV